jgi:tetratricopeptide (TPR) repeat protein
MKTVLLLCLLLSAVLLIYLAHFENTFHFDDAHTVVENPYIRDLRNIPRFFSDARTFSILPANRMYRPLVSASLAIDYWLGSGLEPFFFQLSTFCWFLLQLVVMYMLFREVYDRAHAHPRNRRVALFATAWYGLHPAMAETVNYIIQRADLYSTLGVVTGILVYARAPNLRKYGLYLLPFVAAVLSKAPALIFPAILFVFIWLFEEDPGGQRLARALLRCIPALLLGAGLAYFTSAMTPKEFNPGVPSAYAYRITQPLVALRYFQTFLMPGNLTADTDHTPVPSIWSDWAWTGFVFVLALIALAVLSSKRREWRPVAFGLWWFLLALVPTSIFPLGEVENDHRMFFPFVGLVLSASWPVALWIYHRETPRSRVFTGALALVCFGELAILSFGTLQRNLVWRTEESLWRDVTVKSPRNPRGLMNYGANLVQKGDYSQALAYFERAKTYAPNYARNELNLGVVKGLLKRDAEAEQHFRRALAMTPRDPVANYLYARWLEKTGRRPEAIEQLRLAINANPDYLNAAYFLMEIYVKRGSWDTVRRLSDYFLKRFPSDPDERAYRLMAAWKTGELANPDSAVRSLVTAENFLSVSALYYQSGDYEQSIAAAREALKLRPNYPEAYNNISAGDRALGNWDEAVEAAQQSLRLQPGSRMAQENLARSQRRQQDPAPTFQ